LRDAATGAVADLADGYTFTSEATGWTDRFALALRAGGAASAAPAPATERRLSAPRPNPSSGRSSLTLRLPTAEHVTATVVDALGRTVVTLFDGEAPAGTDVALAVDGSRLAAGVYVVRVQGATFTESRRLVVAR
ncbi:MAG TPA: T9SS type A sorting domain-containing protein, partial [Rubricoccaceae bacterium]